MVTLLLGTPPSPDETFAWQYYDAEGKSKEIKLTPRDFARQATSLGAVRKGSVAPARLFSLVNDPRNEYNRLLTVERLGNVLEGRPLTYANVEMRVCEHIIFLSFISLTRFYHRFSRKRSSQCSRPGILCSSVVT